MTDLTTTIDRIQSGMERVSRQGHSMPTDAALLLRTLILVGRALGELMEDALRPYGLNDTEFRVLVNLFALPDGVGHPGDLCTAAQQTPANMTRITDTLVARGLITRIPSVQDRRRQILELTDQGRALLQQLMPAAFEPLRSLLTVLPTPELQQILGQLKRIAAAIDETTRARDSSALASELTAQ
ncbi:MAG: MarR family transcriptional regulator [Steroidobacteraceae bacterium]|jgi:MarR family transcriptional repressor of emrRAB